MSTFLTLKKLPSAADLELYGLTQADMQSLFGDSTTREVVEEDEDFPEEDMNKYCSLGKTGSSLRFPNGYDAVWMNGGFALPLDWFSGEKR